MSKCEKKRSEFMGWTLVTGGAKRLGAKLCLDLAAHGHAVLVHYHTSQREAKEVVDACRSLGATAEMIQGDFSTTASTEDFIRMCQKLFPIKILINNIGNYLVKSASNTTLEEWCAVFQSNLHVPFALSRAFLPSLCQHQGSIINIGIAGVGNMRADTYSTAYTAAKMALLMLTKSLAKEMAPKGLCVNMISPGYLENAIDLPQDVTQLPMERAATLEEVSRVVMYLLDEQSRYITGQNIEVAGGVRL